MPKAPLQWREPQHFLPYFHAHTTLLRPFSANNGSKRFGGLLDFIATKKGCAKELFLG